MPATSEILELTKADHEHGARVAEWLADMLEKICSKWPRARLVRLVAFTFAIYSAVTWEAAAMQGEFDRDLETWRDAMIGNLLANSLNDAAAAR